MATIIYKKETGDVLHIIPRNLYKQSKFAQNLVKYKQDFIIADEIPEITDKRRQKLMVENSELKVVDLELSPEEEKSIRLYEINSEIHELKQSLSSTDYQAIKYAEGELSVEEYEPIKIQRREWRLKINNLEEQLSELNRKD